MTCSTAGRTCRYVAERDTLDREEEEEWMAGMEGGEVVEVEDRRREG